MKQCALWLTMSTCMPSKSANAILPPSMQVITVLPCASAMMSKASSLRMLPPRFNHYGVPPVPYFTTNTSSSNSEFPTKLCGPKLTMFPLAFPVM